MIEELKPFDALLKSKEGNDSRIVERYIYALWMVHKKYAGKKDKGSLYWDVDLSVVPVIPGTKQGIKGWANFKSQLPAVGRRQQWLNSYSEYGIAVLNRSTNPDTGTRWRTITVSGNPRAVLECVQEVLASDGSGVYAVIQHKPNDHAWYLNFEQSGHVLTSSAYTQVANGRTRVDTYGVASMWSTPPRHSEKVIEAARACSK